MKKLVMLLGTMLLAVGSAAHAAPTQFCIDFVNFCDGFQLVEGDGGALVGQWVNNDCAGAHTDVTGQDMGAGNMQVVCSTFATCPAGFIWIFKIHAGQAGNGVFNMLGYDGTNAFPQQIGQPFSRTDGACGANGDKPSIPSTAARG